MLLTTLNNIDDVFDNFFTARPYEFRPFNKSSNHKIEHDDDKLHNARVDLRLNAKVWDKLKWQMEV